MRASRPTSTAPRAAVRADRGPAPRSSDCIARGHGRRGHARSTPTTCSSPPAASRSSTSSARRSSTRATSIVAEAPTYPGAVPAFSRLPGRRRADRDGRRRHADRRARGDARPPRGRGPAAEVHLHDPELPEPGRRDDVAAAPPAARRGRRTSASCSCSRTTRTGCCATRASRCRRCCSLDGGEFVIYLGTFSKILSPGVRLGWAVAPRPVLEKMNIGKQGADLCSSSLTPAASSPRTSTSGRWQDYLGELRELYRRRRDVMLDALAEHFPPEATWTQPAGRPVHLGDAARLHRHDRPARPRARGAQRRVRPRPRGVPRRPRRLVDAAELLRRRRGRHPRGRAAHRRGRRASRSSSTAR